MSENIELTNTINCCKNCIWAAWFHPSMKVSGICADTKKMINKDEGTDCESFSPIPNDLET
jgi:hypothetical protein